MQKNHFKIVVIVIILASAVFPRDAETAASEEKPDFNVIIGEWVRSDGGYIVRIRDVNPDGSVDAGYFNPAKTNISEADVSLWKGFVKLFIKLQTRDIPDRPIRSTITPKKTPWPVSTIKPQLERLLK